MCIEDKQKQEKGKAEEGANNSGFQHLKATPLWL